MYRTPFTSTTHGYETPFSSNAPSSPTSNTGTSLIHTGLPGLPRSIVAVPIRERLCLSRPVTSTSTIEPDERGIANDAPVYVVIHSRVGSGFRIVPSFDQ